MVKGKTFRETKGDPRGKIFSGETQVESKGGGEPCWDRRGDGPPSVGGDGCLRLRARQDSVVWTTQLDLIVQKKGQIKTKCDHE